MFQFVVFSLFIFSAFLIFIFIVFFLYKYEINSIQLLYLGAEA